MSSLALTGVGGPVVTFPAGMAARWTLDDTSAGYVDLIGGLTLTQGGSGVTTAAGVIGDAYSKGATNGRLTTTGLTLAGTFAVEVWDKYASETYYVAQWSAGATFSFAVDSYGASGRVRFYLYDGVGTAIVTGTSAGSAGVWRHIAAVYDSTAALASRLRVYVNGVQQATGAVAGAAVITPAHTFYVGGARGASVDSKAVTLDELAVYDLGAAADPGGAYWLDRYNGGAGRRP